jgi:hypothetical protein
MANPRTVHYPKHPGRVPVPLASAAMIACGVSAHRLRRPGGRVALYAMTDRASAVTCGRCRRLARKGSDHAR